MKSLRLIVFLIISLLLSSCGAAIVPPTVDNPLEEATSQIVANVTSENDVSATPEVISPTPSNTSTPNPFASLYGCEMQLSFTSGPLETKNTQFNVLGEDYFSNKDDKFKPGKGTSIYYQNQHYFIIHSSYVNGNILRPMEGEFIRKYLEYWGSSGNAYIQGQIDSLIGSEVIWSCNGEQVFSTKISGIAHLSHAASNRLWLEPEKLEQIIVEREGLVSEWVGEITPTSEPHLYIAFCGWGPDDNANDRYTYFRYLLQFEIIGDN